MAYRKFSEVRDAILGKSYDLSIAYVSTKISRKINNEKRGKDKPTNVLSFSLGKNSGELILCPDVIKAEAPKWGLPYTKFLGFLVIHGMLHLKGMEHGSKMELMEKKFCKQFGFK